MAITVCAAVLLSACNAPAPTQAAGELTSATKPATVKKTYVFKKIGDVELKADVYRLNDTQPRPVLVWLHGGALIFGHREGITKQLRDFCNEQGYVLVSLDYRLAPQVKLPQIIEDIQAGFDWVHREGPKLFAADTRRLVVAGGSAGGYLAMMTGICIEPKPTAIVSYFGYGDVDGEWQVKPWPHYVKTVEPISEAKARAGAGTKVITEARWGTKMCYARRDYYRYLRQNGLWTKEVTGFDPASQRDRLTPYCPVRNVTPDYPPIIMIHGTGDTDVPHSKSVEMAAELKKHGVPHELVLVEGAGHGLFSGGTKADRAAAHKQVEQFMAKHLAPAEKQ